MNATTPARTELNRLIERAVRYRADGRVDAAAQALDAARSVATAAGDVEPPLLARLDILAGQVSLDQQRCADALTHFARGADMLSALDDDVLLVYARIQQGEALRAMGRYNEARRTLTVALDHVGHRLGADSLAAAGVHNAHGCVAQGDGRLRHRARPLPRGATGLSG